MTQTAARTSAKTAALSDAVTELEVGRIGSGILNKLANARIARLLAEKAEKPLKEKAAALWAGAAQDLKVGDVLLVKAGGTVRGKVALKKRPAKVDWELLQTAFPEAYDKCVDEEVYSPQFDPA